MGLAVESICPTSTHINIITEIKLRRTSKNYLSTDGERETKHLVKIPSHERELGIPSIISRRFFLEFSFVALRLREQLLQELHSITVDRWRA
jgi:hypothetical protein